MKQLREYLAWPGDPPSAAQVYREVPLDAHVVLHQGDGSVEVQDRPVIVLPNRDESVEPGRLEHHH